MSSSNIIQYRILKNGETAGYYKYNISRKSTFEELLKYQPLSEHTVIPWGYDEEEGCWSDEEENLNDFLLSMVHSNKEIREYFVNEELNKKKEI